MEVEQVVIHGVVFVKIAGTQTDEIRVFPNVYSYMMDPARRNAVANVRSFAIIPDAQMRLLKAMLGQQEYDVDFATQFSVGEHVRIVGFESYDEFLDEMHGFMGQDLAVTLQVSQAQRALLIQQAMTSKLQ